MTGVLLVHGAWHGGWCWDGFAERLRSSGLDARTIDLRGHDKPGLKQQRIWHTIGDYVEDVEKKAKEFDRPPAIIGHSMGGLVVQKYLARNHAPAAVLLASVPTSGALGTTLRFAGRHPLAFLHTNAALRLWPVLGNKKRAREMLFTPHTPDAIVDANFAMLQDESYPAYLGMILSLPRPRKVRAPVLVIAGGEDRIFTVGEAARTARAYMTEPVVFPGMGHNLMSDTGWEKVADTAADWIKAV